MSSLINILSSQSFKIFNIWGPLKLREETFPSCRGRQSPNLRKSLSCFIEDFRYLACFTCWIYDAEDSCELGVSYFLQQIMFLWSSSWGSSIFSALWHSYWGVFCQKANFGFFEKEKSVQWKGKFWPKFSQNLPFVAKICLFTESSK